MRGQLVHEGLVREGVLEPRRRAQRSGPEARFDVVREHAAALYSPGAAGEVRRHTVAVVVDSRRRGTSRSGRELRRRESQQRTGDDVPGPVGSRTSAQARRPRLVIPRCDVPAGIERSPLVDHKRVAVILKRHLVLARELHAHRFADGLGKDRGVVGHGIGAVAAVAARAAPENHANVLGLQAQDHRRGVFLIPDGLRSGVDRGFLALRHRPRRRSCPSIRASGRGEDRWPSRRSRLRRASGPRRPNRP